MSNDGINFSSKNNKKLILLIALLVPFYNYGQIVKSYEQLHEKINLILTNGSISIYPLAENAFRIKYNFNDQDNNIPEFIFSEKTEINNVKVNELPSKILIEGKHIIVIADKQTGVLSYADRTGKIFLSEKENSRKLLPYPSDKESFYVAEQSFLTSADEYIFGLGQFQDGHYNLNGITRHLTQVNSQIAIPFIYSSKGYGLLWHQYGMTDYNPADNIINLEPQQIDSEDQKTAEVTTTSGTHKVSQNQSIYTGKFSVPQYGEYSIFLDLGDMGNRHFIAIDGKPVVDISNFWLPPTVSALVELKAGEHQVQVICKSDNKPKLCWKPKDNYTTFRSSHATMIDYVVFLGSADEVIASYRSLTGQAPLFPKWAYGFWQCRERYTSSTHLIETVQEFRKRNLPMDVIVQDWQYWGNNGWGVPKFDETHYPNPSDFIKKIHDLNARFVISVWSNPDKNSEIGKYFVANNLFIPDTKWLDYFNPETRKQYWNTLNENLFSYGVDGWWMDAVEPENDALAGTHTYIGNGYFYRLTYPLMVSKAVYEGQRNTTLDKRVCILTRSAFSGQQRYGIINWSGDIGGDWETFKRQIVAGLNYSMSGLPYWTTDIGGFFRPGNSQYTDKNYHELLIRWFQWGAFNPIFRVHGYMSETEPWKYGQLVEEMIREVLHWRYQFIPYIYSEAWQITKNGSTIMRPLVMDFGNDPNAINQPYEFMFGHSLLIAPIVEAGARKREVYLPQSVNWFNFWTGESIEGGRNVTVDAPLNKIPLFVKAGSIIPIGPVVQHTNGYPSDTLEIRIYEGADGTFTLYEDEGDNYNYEKGMYSVIDFIWNEAKKTLVINDRKGEFPGMLKERLFNIKRVKQQSPSGVSDILKYDKIITYKGKKMIIKFH